LVNHPRNRCSFDVFDHSEVDMPWRRAFAPDATTKGFVDRDAVLRREPPFVPFEPEIGERDFAFADGGEFVVEKAVESLDMSGAKGRLRFKDTDSLMLADFGGQVAHPYAHGFVVFICEGRGGVFDGKGGVDGTRFPGLPKKRLAGFDTVGLLFENGEIAQGPTVSDKRDGTFPCLPCAVGIKCFISHDAEVKP